MDRGLNLWPITRIDPVSEMFLKSLSRRLSGNYKDAAVRVPDDMYCIWDEADISACEHPTPVIQQCLYSGMAVVERIGLIICECKSRLTWPKYTIRLLQTVLQEGNGQFFLPWTIPPSDISPYPAQLRFRIRSGVSRIRVKIESVGLGLVGLVLWLKLELWFGLEGKCLGGEMFDTPTRNIAVKQKKTQTGSNSGSDILTGDPTQNPIRFQVCKKQTPAKKHSPAARGINATAYSHPDCPTWNADVFGKQNVVRSYRWLHWRTGTLTHATSKLVRTVRHSVWSLLLCHCRANQRCGTVCLNSFGNRTSPSYKGQDNVTYQQQKCCN